MALLGANVLPERVQRRRRQVRSRLQNIREPIQQRRKEFSPLNVIGMVEGTAKSLRDRFINRQTVLDRIKARRADSGGTSGSGTSNGSSNSSGSSQEPETMT